MLNHDNARLNHVNNHQLLDELSRLQKISIILFGGVGSTANVELRCGRKCLVRTYGNVPQNATFLSIDAADEIRVDDVDLLGDGSFLNLSDDDELLPRLKAAGSLPRYRDRLPPEACNIAGGAGSGSLPPVAEFFFEQSEPRISAKLGGIVDRFRGSNRGVTAQAANRLLLSHGMAVQSSGPINAVFAASLVGGTAGGLLEYVRQTRKILTAKGISANYFLFATLPAVGVDGVDGVAMLQNTYGRLQELADANAMSPLFDFVFLTPEPTAGELDKHSRLMGGIFASLVSQLGAAFLAKAVDTRRVLTQPGPLRQPKFLSLINRGLLTPAVCDVVQFARSQFAEALLEHSQNLTRQSPLTAHGITLSLINPDRFRLPSPVVPTRVHDDNAQAFIDTARRRQSAAAEQLVKKHGDDLSHAASIVVADLQNWFTEELLQNGPRSARQLAEMTSQGINAIKAQAHAELGRARAAATTATDRSTEDRLQAITADVQRDAFLKYLRQAIPLLKRLEQTADAAYDRYCLMSEAFSSAASQSQNIRRRLVPVDTELFSFLDEAALTNLVAPALKGVVANVRRRAAQIAADDLSVEQLSSVVEAVTAQAANEFSELNRIDDAYRAAGTRAEIVIDNFIAATEPKCRQQAFWDRRTESMRWAFVTAPAGHPVVQALQAKTGRNVRCVPMMAEEIVVMTADFGIEIGSLTVTEEAVSAYYECPSGFPPFARADYEPQTELLSAPEPSWFEILALPLHLHLDTGTMGRDDIDGFYYADGAQRVLLGSSWMEAWQKLSGEHRRAGLPPLADLGRSARQALFDGRSSIDVLDVLKELESKLTEALEFHERQQPFLRWRSVLRTMLTEFRARLNEARCDHRVWGAAAGQLSHDAV